MWDILEWFLGLANYVIGGLTYALWEIFKRLFALVAGTLNSLLATVGLPAIIIPPVTGPLLGYARTANYWLPLQEAWTFAARYFALWLAVLVVKKVLKGIGLVWAGGWS